MKKVSVIIPVYNLEKYVAHCLDSVCCQSYDNLEILIINDGSTDSTEKICQEYAAKDNRIRVISKQNGGVSSARNIGLDNATGDFICFVDGDDFCSPDMISTLTSAVGDEDSAVRCGYVISNNYNYKWKEPKTEFIKFCQFDYLKMILNGQAEIGVWATLFKRNLIGELRFDINLRDNEDKLFLFEYIMKNAGMVHVTEKKMYGYYCRHGSVTRSKKFKTISCDIIKSNEIILQLTEKNVSELISDAKRNLQSARLNVMKKIVEGGAYRTEKELFQSIKKDVLNNKITDTSMKMKMEQTSLSAGDWTFISCVRMYRCFFRRNNNG